VPLTAKYPTTCGLCSLPVSPGDEIAKAGARWAHVACAADGQQDLLAAAGVGPTATSPAGPAKSATSSAKNATSSATGATSPAKRTARKTSPAMTEIPGALEVWTDGACSGNPGPGGWAWATEDGRQGSGAESPTTNQRMEIQAALEAVKALDGPLTVVSDSTYVVNCFKDAWWKGWLARGWVNSAKKPVANRDLWEPLITLYTERGDIAFRWVKGHSGDKMNDLVDQLAVKAGKGITD
jgi:ribonuclease HI